MAAQEPQRHLGTLGSCRNEGVLVETQEKGEWVVWPVARTPELEAVIAEARSEAERRGLDRVPLAVVENGRECRVEMPTAEEIESLHLPLLEKRPERITPPQDWDDPEQLKRYRAGLDELFGPHAGREPLMQPLLPPSRLPPDIEEPWERPDFFPPGGDPWNAIFSNTCSLDQYIDDTSKTLLEVLRKTLEIPQIAYYFDIQDPFVGDHLRLIFQTNGALERFRDALGTISARVLDGRDDYHQPRQVRLAVKGPNHHELRIGVEELEYLAPLYRQWCALAGVLGEELSKGLVLRHLALPARAWPAEDGREERTFLAVDAACSGEAAAKLKRLADEIGGDPATQDHRKVLLPRNESDFVFDAAYFERWMTC